MHGRIAEQATNGARGRVACAAVLAVLLCSLAVCSNARVPAARAPVVSFYGDSIGAQSQSYLTASLAANPTRVDLQAHTMGGLALCDFATRILDDISTRRASVVVLEFAGNNLSPCMRDADGAGLVLGTDAYFARYREGIRAAFRAGAERGVKVVWATTPPRASSDLTDRLTAIAREEAAGLVGVTVADTGAVLTEDGTTFTPTLPCLDDEIGRGCGSDGRIQVRDDDGLHLAGAYAPGARRFGDALARAALSALGA